MIWMAMLSAGAVSAIAAFIAAGFLGNLTAAISSAMIAGIVGGLIGYMDLPVLSLWFWSFVGYVLLGGLIGTTLGVIVANSKAQGGSAVLVGSILVWGGTIVFMLATSMGSSGMMRADDWRKLLGAVPEVDFTQAIDLIDTNGQRQHLPNNQILQQDSIRLVDDVIAKRRAQEVLSSDPSLGSAFAVGELQIQAVKGRLTWVAPLEFTGITRWAAGGGAPGYILIDAHDFNQARLVQKLQDKPLNLACGTSHYLSDNVHRIAWGAVGGRTGLTNISFEIDDDGKPYWIATTYEPRIGFDGHDPTGIVLIDAQTCQAQVLSMAQIPAWVDRVVPADMLEDQLEAWGAYVHGWWNSVFGQGRDVVKISSRMEMVYTADGRAMWYTGLHMPSNPNGTTGFVLVDARTKNATRFQLNGASEGAMRQSMAGHFSNMQGWTATWPILYNLNGHPTYLSSIKDQAGNFKGVALGFAGGRHVVVHGPTLRDALTNYASALVGAEPSSATAAGPLQALSGIVARRELVVIEGKSALMFTLVDQTGRAFLAPMSLGPQAMLTQAGDMVRLSVRAQNAQPEPVEALLNAHVIDAN